MNLSKPFSQSCENNKQPLLDILCEVFTEAGQILEIGSGSGQHAVFFASHLAHIIWQPSDQAVYLPGIRLWTEEADLDNLMAPLELDVQLQPWPVHKVDGVFSANTAHIMHWPAVDAMFSGVGEILSPANSFCLYGPFKYADEHTSASNAQFDRQLRHQDPEMGIRDVVDLQVLAAAHRLKLVADHAMPANNRTLVWQHF